MIHTLPDLSYSFDALEPLVDTRTMEIHYTKHHQAYVDNLNKALVDFPEAAGKPLFELLSDLEKVPEKIRMAIRNLPQIPKSQGRIHSGVVECRELGRGRKEFPSLDLTRSLVW
mgnify:CR=1 FL=1